MLAFSKSLVSLLKARPPPKLEMRKAIFEKTQVEQAAGSVSRFLDKEELDSLFGREGWAAIMRFAIWQHSEYRMIDNGRHGANWTYSADETIHTTSAAALLL